MSQEHWEIQKYVTEDGICPFDSWFNALDTQAKARIDVRLDRLILGNFGDHKPVGEGVYELRFFFGPGYRVYYAISGNQIVLLLTGGEKKRQSKDIQSAQTLWKHYKTEQEGV
ncbi:MAG: type II toxin-antitoxin system RelE/ParE family toxin [Cyanobacteria bacterium P01_A01_bin.114]